MLLTCVIPFRSRSTTRNWSLVSRLCLQTIRSCLNSCIDDTRVILIGHERPAGLRGTDDSRLLFVEADWAAPDLRNLSDLSMQDKWRKVRKGFARASALETDYIMIIDADDLISSAVPKYLSEQRPGNGLVFKNGYLYQHGQYLALKMRGNFNCGTNAVLNVSQLHMPQDDSDEEARRCIALTAGHTIIEEKMAERGTPLEPAPFFAAAHVTHGEQDSLTVGQRPRYMALRRYIREPHRLTFFGRTKRREFGIAP